MRYRHTLRSGLESLERRVLLTVNATLSDGDLLVSGDSDGPIQIVAQDADSYQVLDNSVEVAVVDGVTKGVQLEMGDLDDDIVLDLAGQTLRGHLRAHLGEGTNRLQLVNGRIGGQVLITGGAGADTVDVQSDVVVGKHVRAMRKPELAGQRKRLPHFRLRAVRAVALARALREVEIAFETHNP